ncbi:MAG: nucleoside monophosphate kinase [Candidatus Saccharibacteria bacterium]
MKRSLFLISGKPGSGKSTCCKEAVMQQSEWSMGLTVRHFAVGSHVRGILAGEIESKFHKRLNQHSRSITGMRMIDNGIIAAVVDEYLSYTEDKNLILMDGFPTQIAQLPLLPDILDNNNTSVIGAISVDVSDTVAASRQVTRRTGDRHPVHTRELAEARLRTYGDETEGTRQAMFSYWDGAAINGEMPLKDMVNEFIGKLAMRI